MRNTQNLTSAKGGFYYGKKAKYTADQKVQACVDFLSGKKSASEIVRELDMGKQGHIRIRH